VKQHSNLTAYFNAESMDNFANHDEVVSYREKRKKRYKDFIVLMHDLFANLVSVIEIGSGSSALLYAMNDAKKLDFGIGVEISPKRHNFAEIWKKDEGISNVKNMNDDFSNIEFKDETSDLFIVIDDTFAYLQPEDELYPTLLLDKAWKSLVKGGRIIIDVINYHRNEPGVEHWFWNQFSEDDPFQFGLYEKKIIDNVNHSKSIFIARDGSTDVKIDLSYVYSQEVLTKLIESSGFVVEGVFSNFRQAPYLPETSERLVVLAKKF